MFVVVTVVDITLMLVSHSDGFSDSQSYAFRIYQNRPIANESFQALVCFIARHHYKVFNPFRALPTFLLKTRVEKNAVLIVRVLTSSTCRNI